MPSWMPWGSITLASVMNVDVALDRGNYPVAIDSHKLHAAAI